MIGGVPAAGVRVSLQQPQFAQQARMVGQTGSRICAVNAIIRNIILIMDLTPHAARGSRIADKARRT